MSGIGKAIGQELAVRAVLWAGGLAAVLFVLPRVLPSIAKAVGGALPAVGNAAGQVAGAAVGVVNPVNPENIFYQIANGVGTGISGDKDFTVGGWLYELTHGDANAPATPGAKGVPENVRRTVGPGRGATGSW